VGLRLLILIRREALGRIKGVGDAKMRLRGIASAAVGLLAGMSLLAASPAGPAPQAGSWKTLTSESRSDHTATLLKDGKVLVAGGCVPGKKIEEHCDHPTDSVQLFDPKTNRWRRAQHMINARSSHSAAVLPDGRVLVVGGDTPKPGPAPFSTIETAEIYNPSTGKWALTKPLAASFRSGEAMNRPPRLYQPVLKAFEGSQAVACGRSCGKALAVGSFTAQLFDSSSNAWTKAADPHPSIFHSLSLTGSGKALLLSAEPGASLFDPAANTWSTAAVPLIARAFSTATTLDDGTVLAAGGSLADQTSSAAADLFDSKAAGTVGTLGVWSPTVGLHEPRAEHDAVLLKDGKVLVLGGGSRRSTLALDLPASPLSSAELYDPTSRTWSAAAPMQTPRAGNFTATALADGRVLVLGGDSTSAEIYSPIGIVQAESSPSGKRNSSDSAFTAAAIVLPAVLVAAGAYVFSKGRAKARA